ncbi:MAG: hypothetical protein ACI3WQ_10870, partial [Faecousia sp.]
MNVTSKISVDLTKPNVCARVEAVQGDGNTRYVEVALLSGGNPWEPSDGVEPAVAYRKPDYTKGLYNKLADGDSAITISGNVATIILAPQMLTTAGTVQTTLVFNDAQLNRLTTFPFSVSVAANPGAGAQKSEDYIRLQWLEDKLDEYIGKIEGGATDEAVVQRIVDAYLAANPPTVTETDPTVPAWAKQPQKPTYTAAEVGALSAETLPAAINTALAQAKDSGEFDGKDGDPGADGYSPTANVAQTDTGAVITITDKTGTTTATLKNGADGQPGHTGATPNIQIGTVETLEAGSAATASMDGTPENPILNLGIPQGAPGSGGGGGIAVTGATVGQTIRVAAVDDDGVPTAWEAVDLDGLDVIADVTLEKDTSTLIFSEDLNGQPFELKKVVVELTSVKQNGDWAPAAGETITFNGLTKQSFSVNNATYATDNYLYSFPAKPDAVTTDTYTGYLFAKWELEFDENGIMLGKGRTSTIWEDADGVFYLTNGTQDYWVANQENYFTGRLLAKDGINKVGIKFHYSSLPVGTHIVIKGMRM